MLRIFFVIAADGLVAQDDQSPFSGLWAMVHSLLRVSLFDVL